MLCLFRSSLKIPSYHASIVNSYSTDSWKWYLQEFVKLIDGNITANANIVANDNRIADKTNNIITFSSGNEMSSKCSQLFYGAQ